MSDRVVFMGSPEFALPSLRRLNEHMDVVGVVTQPDRPAGRGREISPPPVKRLALEMDIPLIQPGRLRDPRAMEQLRAWAPDVIVVAAFGQILKPEVLGLPPHGCVNVHASLLPRWRGAAPIQAAILHGDRETGVTIMRMDPGVDTGPVLRQKAIRISPEDTAGTLSPRLAEIGAELLVETLPAYLSGALIPSPQDDSRATFAPMLKKADGELDFQQTAEALARRVRAFHPWPGTFLIWEDRRLAVHQAHAHPGPSPGIGVRTSTERSPAIGTPEGILVLDTVQPAGKRAMAGDVFYRGARDWDQVEFEGDDAARAT